MLDIEGKHIAELSDEDLRKLIALLCEAELKAKNLSTACVTSGGHQDAKDGGVDVRVKLRTTIDENGYIPRTHTVYQSKKSKMPPNAIEREMKPKGKLSESIRELVECRGAYIIVSGKDSTSDVALRNRINAMKKALEGCPNPSEIYLDFYDQVRMASWVRSHPGIVLWVRYKIGQRFTGWRPHDNWARCPHGIDEEYIVDESLRLHPYPNLSHDDNGISIIEGINHIRELLHKPSASVRLVGLSGVGKTRLLQALFDHRIGEKALHQSDVLYTDLSDSPDPDPTYMAEQIIVSGNSAILAIDNCPPELHKKLTETCCKENSRIRLITVEYDVKEDQSSDETEVYRLEPTSDEVIITLISNRFEHINDSIARFIAELSGGNARIAILLAERIKKSDTIGSLTDRELFKRLFHQRNKEELDSDLLQVAEVCSLFYSFDSRTEEGEKSEIGLLGSLVEMSVKKVYAQVSELTRRGLAQERGDWRAVMPQALANRLAHDALQNIPIDDILTIFEKPGSERLLKSFSKRLSYIEKSKEAREISKKWLSKGGLLEDISHLNELGIQLLVNIAPVYPELVLDSLERVQQLEDAPAFFSRDNQHYYEFTRLLRSLAYKSTLFDRAVTLLGKFALTEDPDENMNSIRDLLQSLFSLYLSGTHATSNQRLAFIQSYVESTCMNQIELGITLLEKALSARHFSSMYDFQFGSRVRDYGYSPTNEKEIYDWYHLFIQYTVSLAVSNLPVATLAKSLFAKSFRELWMYSGMWNELDLAVQEISRKGFWKECWLAIRETKAFDKEKMSPKMYERLDFLDTLLEPKSLIEKVQTFVLSTEYIELGDDYLFDMPIKDQDSNVYLTVDQQIAYALGQQIGEQADILNEILPELLSTDGKNLFDFGQGLADACSNPQMMWSQFRNELLEIIESERRYEMLRGFLRVLAERDPNLTDKILDDAVADEAFTIKFPYFQTAVLIDDKGVERLKLAIKLGLAPISTFQYLAYGRVHKSINDTDLCDLLRMMIQKPDGLNVAIEILTCRLHGQERNAVISQDIVSLGQELLLKVQFGALSSSMDNKLAQIIKHCFGEVSALEHAKVLCSRIVVALQNYYLYLQDCSKVIVAIAKKQPIAILEVFLGDRLTSNERVELLNPMSSRNLNILSYIDDDLIIHWCEEDAQQRYSLVASCIIPYRKNKEQDNFEWTPLALEILGHSTDPFEVLDRFIASFSPRVWSGSRAGILQSKMCLITALKTHENSQIAECAYRQEVILAERIHAEREWELKREREKNERFEY